MKITHIGAQNYLRIVEADIQVRCPLLLLAGENEQGKTSIADAVYHAMTGIVRRVGQKKDYGRLVYDGQKRGNVVVAMSGDSDEEAHHYVVTVPADKRALEGIDEQPLLQYLLDPGRFFTMKPEERRHLLFSITGKRITGKTILEKLREQGADPKKTTDIGAVLLAGFAAGQEEAKKRASEARGAWKELAGENYGSKKADDWKAPKPEYDASRIEPLGKSIAEARMTAEKCHQRLGEMNTLRNAARAQQQRRIALVDIVDQIGRREAKLKADQDLVDEWAAKVAEAERRAGTGPKVTPVPCPHCGSLVEIHGNPPVLHQHDPEKAGDPQSIALLPGYRDTLAKVTHARDNAKLHLEQANNAKVQLTELDANPAEEPSTEEAQNLSAQLTAAQQSEKALQETLDAIRAAENLAQKADASTARAAQLHKDVGEWEDIADRLAPGGIQSELLTEAMKPFNDRLDATAARTGWDAVTISPDMDILVGGRLYQLASASAQWRARAAIVEAMSFVSGQRIFMLDEIELLIGPNRLTFLMWMHQLATDGEVDTAILIGSFKEKPKCPPTFQVEWVEAGRVGAQPQEQMAA